MGFVDNFLGLADDVADKVDKDIFGATDEELYKEDYDKAMKLKREWEDSVITAKDRARKLNQDRGDFTVSEPLRKKYRDSLTHANRYDKDYNDEEKGIMKDINQDFQDARSMTFREQGVERELLDTYMGENTGRLKKYYDRKKEEGYSRVGNEWIHKDDITWDTPPTNEELVKRATKPKDTEWEDIDKFMGTKPMTAGATKPKDTEWADIDKFMGTNPMKAGI